MELKIIDNNNLKEALSLVLNVFMEFEAPVYSVEGINTFKDFLKSNQALDKMNFFGAYQNDKVVGVLATRELSHISLFFVKKEYQNKGIGKALFNFMLENTKSDKLTVNSSPYAVNIYEKLGFKKQSEEKLDDGIRYTPMLYKIKNN